MMLTQSVDVEADRLGQLDLLENLAEARTGSDLRPTGFGDRLGKAGDSKFHVSSVSTVGAG